MLYLQGEPRSFCNTPKSRLLQNSRAGACENCRETSVIGHAIFSVKTLADRGPRRPPLGHGKPCIQRFSAYTAGSYSTRRNYKSKWFFTFIFRHGGWTDAFSVTLLD
jgi:hypothetical protein